MISVTDESVTRDIIKSVVPGVLTLLGGYGADTSRILRENDAVCARVTTFQAQPDKLTKALKIITTRIAPAVREQSGFEGISILSDSVTANGMVITYWSTQENLDALDARGFWEAQVAHGIYLIAAVPRRQTYDVAMRE